MKLRSDFLGSGRVGNLVGVKGYDGEYYARKYVKHPRNPNTLAQQKQRSKMSLMGAFMGHIAGWVNIMFMNNGKMSNFAQAVKRNIKTGITGTFPNFEIDYTLCLVAAGSVDNPYSPSATADGTSLSLTWSDNSGMGNALTDDKVCVMAYNPTKNQAVYGMDLAERNERSTTFNLPTAWTGDTVNVWMAMKRDFASSGEGQIGHKAGRSNSIHLASLTL